MIKLKRIAIAAAASAVMLGSMAAPVFAGSLSHSQLTTPPADGPGDLVRVCTSTTENGDAVINEGVSGVSPFIDTFISEDCSI